MLLCLLELQVDLILLLEEVGCLCQRGNGKTGLLEELSHTHVARLKLLEVLAEFAELHNVIVEVLLEVGFVWVEVCSASVDSGSRVVVDEVIHLWLLELVLAAEAREAVGRLGVDLELGIAHVGALLVGHVDHLVILSATGQRPLREHLVTVGLLLPKLVLVEVVLHHLVVFELGLGAVALLLAAKRLLQGLVHGLLVRTTPDVGMEGRLCIGICWVRGRMLALSLVEGGERGRRGHLVLLEVEDVS